MGEFMTHHPGQFIVIEQIDETSGECHRITLLIYATGKGVQLRVVDHVDLRHIHATRHGQILHYIIYAHIL